MNKSAGFTLIEIMAVILIIGVAIAIVLPQLDNLSPKYRLRGAVREIMSWVEEIRSNAIWDGKSYWVMYDMEDNEYWVRLPADEEGEEEDMLVGKLPSGVEFVAVIYPDNEECTGG